MWPSGRWRLMGRLVCVRLGIVAACETERRPRGASRINPLPHLLQRAEPVTPWLPALVHVLNRANRLTTMASQAWPRCNRCRIYPRCAARAALGLAGAEKCNDRLPPFTFPPPRSSNLYRHFQTGCSTIRSFFRTAYCPTPQQPLSIRLRFQTLDALPWALFKQSTIIILHLPVRTDLTKFAR